MRYKNNSLIYCSVRIKGDEIAELDEKYDDKVVLAIPKDKVKQLSLLFGRASERPLMDFIIGFLFLAAGLFIALPLLKNIYDTAISLETEYFSPQAVKTLGAPLLFFLFSFYFFFLAFRKRYFLLVKTNKDFRKIIFKGKVKEEYLLEFIEKVSKIFGWKITLDESIFVPNKSFHYAPFGRWTP